MNLEVRKYKIEDQNIWDNFIEKSKNSTFLFKRDFMDYHCDRFKDHSLMVYAKSKIICCFPANEKNENTIISHGGLTYGGFIVDKEIKQPLILESVKSILKYYQENNCKVLIYKAFPRIYNNIPADEIEYAMFILDSKLIRRDTALVIDQHNKINYSGNIRREAKKAFLSGVEFMESEDFGAFWEKLLIPNLKSRFSVSPVHSNSEIQLLKSRFPSEIKLYLVKSPKGEILSGTVFFLTDSVAHCQYIASTDEGRKLGALNYLFTKLIDQKSVV